MFDDISVLSFTPGRVRLKVSELKQSAALATSLQERIGGLPGIEQVEVNQATGSVLVRYDQHLFATDASAQALQQALAERLLPEEKARLRAWLQSQETVQALRQGLAEYLSAPELERLHAMLQGLTSEA